MKALYIAALVAGSLTAPASAVDGADSATVQKKVCTRGEQKGGSRLSSGRVCLTPAQWREKLGNDWREILSGRSLENDMEALEARTVPVEASGVRTKCNPC